MENEKLDEIFARHIGNGVQQPQTPPQPKETIPSPQQESRSANPLTQAKNEVANAISEKTISDSILKSFNDLSMQGQLNFPKNYPLGNELKLAFYKITTNGALKNCSKASIANAISEMAIQGLQISKTQGYFVTYGNELQFMRSYFGDIALAKRTGLVKDVYAIVIHQGDEVVIDTDEYGRKYVKSFKTAFGNDDNEILGAYAVAVGQNDYKMYEIMTWKQIQANWGQAKTKNVQQKFPDEMAKRTVVRRLLKWVFNTSLADVDSEVSQIIGMYNTGMEGDYVDNEREYDSVDSHNDYINASFENEEMVEDDL